MNILDEVTPRGRLGTTPHKAKVISLNLPFPLLPLGQKITYQQIFFFFFIENNILYKVSLCTAIHYSNLYIKQKNSKKVYLARCVRHVAKSHSQLVITKVRAEHVIIPHICTEGVIPTKYRTF